MHLKYHTTWSIVPMPILQDGLKEHIDCKTCIAHTLNPILYQPLIVFNSLVFSASNHRESLVDLDLLVPPEPVAPLETMACPV